jgi:serine/threonine-protein kinase RsbW
MSQLTTSHSQEGTSAVLAITLPAVAENVMLVRQALDGAVRSLGGNERTSDDVKLAVTEACSNIVKYAYGDSVGPMLVELGIDGSTLMLVANDSGFWRERASDVNVEESGMGIPLMEAVSASFELVTGDGGTRVTMSFPLIGDDSRD